MKKLGIAVLLFMIIALGTELPAMRSSPDFIVILLCWIALIIGLGFGIRSVLAPNDEPDLNRELRRLVPDTAPLCALCNGSLVQAADVATCSQCGVTRRPPPRAGSFLGVMWDRKGETDTTAPS